MSKHIIINTSSKVILFFFFTTYAYTMQGQNMLGYTDVRGDFYVYDSGSIIRLESLPVKSIQPAANSLAYIDNSGTLKYYANHHLISLDIVNPVFYINTDNYLYYNAGYNFSRFNGKDKLLLGNIAYYKYGFSDSIAAIHDYAGYFYAYWKNNFIELEKTPVKQIFSGDNIIAYVSSSNYFKIFYEGKTYETDSYFPVHVQAAANIVAYINTYRDLKIFYKGETFDIFNYSELNCLQNGIVTDITNLPDESKICTSILVNAEKLPLFKAGDDLVAYIDENNNFQVFYKGIITNLENILPVNYEVTDNIIWYIDANRYLKIFYEGKTYTAEIYTPKQIKADKDIVTYIDTGGKLKAFYKGDFYDISDNIASNYTLNNSTIMYSDLKNNYKFFSFE